MVDPHEGYRALRRDACQALPYGGQALRFEQGFQALEPRQVQKAAAYGRPAIPLRRPRVRPPCIRAPLCAHLTPVETAERTRYRKRENVMMFGFVLVAVVFWAVIGFVFV